MKIKVDIENKEEVLRWLERIKKGTDDARPLWRAMTSNIEQFINNQFQDGSSANITWKPLTPAYKTWKAKKGFPTGVGVMTDTLRKGSSEQAKKKYRRKSLEWSVNQSLTNPFTEKRLGTYATFFNAKRPVYDNTVIRVNSFLSSDVKSFNGGNFNSFTYIWLRKQIRELK